MDVSRVTFPEVKKMAAVIASRGKIAIFDSWLSARTDYGGYISLADAKVLLRELDDAVKSLEMVEPQTGIEPA